MGQMIYFLFARANRSPVIDFLRSIWPVPLGARVEPVCYEELNRFQPGPGLYIFTDVEIMDEESRARAVALHRQLKAEPGQYRVWNDPSRSTRRFELLERLWSEGKNSFRAYRLGEGATPPVPAGMRYPVFVRDENLHRGPLTPLLENAAAVSEAVAKLRAPGAAGAGGPLLAVEFLDYQSPDGVYRKYAYMRLGEKCSPRHLLFSHDFSVKAPKGNEFDGRVWLDEEMRYLKTDGGHGAQIRELFESCAIEFGRIDYTVVNGRVQVFEINSNPVMLKPSYFTTSVRKPVHIVFREELLRALDENDPSPGVSLWRKLRWRFYRPKLNPKRRWRLSGGRFNWAYPRDS
jgi:hypothetical protein